ncbi:MAG: GNAT family N-acetyltransferase [Coprobacillus sp.]
MKELKIENYSEFKPYLDLANYEGYNSNFVTMMMWNHEYHIQYEIHDHFMVMLHNFKGEMFWAMPFTDEEHYQEAINYMIEYSQKNNFDFIIDCATEEFVNKIKYANMHDMLFIRTPSNDDYIYDRLMLETLSGKKMQKRRNHYNSFIKEYPDYIYRDLDLVNDYDTIISCLTRWEHEKDDISESMTSEIRGIMYLLSSQHLLDFKVGGIFINGQMEAFIIASLLNHSTIQIHVEKANKEIRGLYPAILKELLEHHFEGELYVNREEDMGLENLRKSKQSLHPLKMIRKYRIIQKSIHISKANDVDRDDIINLWKKCFVDENDQSTAYYFDCLYKKENTYVLKNGNHIISVAQIIPYKIMKNSKSIDSFFILGVCTDPNYQKQGFMKQLLKYILDIYTNEVIYLQAYIPDIYRPFGFLASHYHQVIKVDMGKYTCDSNLAVINDYSLLESYYGAFCKQFDEYRIRDTSYWKSLIKRCEAFDEDVVIFDGAGYFIYKEDESQIYISEFIYLDNNIISSMISYFKDSNKPVILECDMKVNVYGEAKHQITMMSNKSTDESINTDKYINEIY